MAKKNKSSKRKARDGDVSKADGFTSEISGKSECSWNIIYCLFRSAGKIFNPKNGENMGFLLVYIVLEAKRAS